MAAVTEPAMADRQGRARFIVLDGIDGCGKSTQAERLVSWLEERGHGPVCHLREPGSTRLGEGLREILLDRRTRIGAASETLLFAAARRQLLDELVRPALAAGSSVVCERFHASTFAYQAVAGGLEERVVLELLEEWASPLLPDRCLILDVDPQEAVRRRGGNADRIEDKGLAYQRKVAGGFRAWCRHDPRARLIDASGSPDEVFEAVLAEVRDGQD